MMWRLLMLNLCFAGTIGIQTTTDFSVQGQQVRGKIKVKNTGNELAQAVHLEIIEPKRAGEAEGSYVPSNVSPGELKEWNYESVNLADIQGQIPIIFRVNYQDTNGYHFSAQSVAIAQANNQDYASMPAPKVSARILREEDGEYKITYQIRNDTDAKFVFKPSLILPNELQVMTTETHLEVGAKKEIEVSYQVATRGALGGSRYNIFLLLRWQDGGIQRAQNFVESLEVRSKSQRFLNWNFEDWVLTILLIFAAILAIFLYRDWILGLKNHKN